MLDFCTVLRARVHCFLTSRVFRGICWKTAVIILVCLWALSPRTASGQTFSAPTAVDFGSLTCTSGIVTTTVVVRNSGLAPLIISGAAVSPTNADFKIVSPANISPGSPLFLNPNVTQAIVVSYNPARIGLISASLVFASNAANASGGINAVALSARRDSSGFVLSTTNIILAEVPLNTPTVASFRVRNTGTKPLSPPTPIFSGAFALDSISPAVVPPGVEATAFVRFFGAPAGVTTASVFSLFDECGRATQVRVFAAVQAPPQITNVSPLFGTIGASVVITGVNLGNAQSVMFGAVAAQSFRIDSPTQITATLGQGASGQVRVGVGGSVAVSEQVFTYIPPPSILFFSPQSGGVGAAITIIGTNLSTVTGVSIGGVPASFTLVSPTQITAFVGQGASGVITLTTPVGTVSSQQAFTFIPPPNVLFITPQSGATGTPVTIIGTNLDSVRSVLFGGVPAQSFSQISATQVLATVGQGASGSVTVRTPGGASQSQQTFAFLSPPSVSFVSPTLGGAGTIVNIIGSEFTNVTGVSFGGVPAQNYIVSSPMQIIATVGAGGASGAIVVSTQSGSTTASQRFNYIAPPAIASFSPTMGGAGTAVNIFGSFFDGVTGVSFGGVPARSFVVVSPSQIQAVVGGGASGTVSVAAQGGLGFSSTPFFFTPTSVRENAEQTTFDISPNPAGNVVTFRYALGRASEVKIEIVSILGRRVAIFNEGVRAAGAHERVYSVESLAQGAYSCRIWVGGEEVRSALLRVVR
jgi:hypothetical protein